MSTPRYESSCVYLRNDVFYLCPHYLNRGIMMLDTPYVATTKDKHYRNLGMLARHVLALSFEKELDSDTRIHSKDFLILTRMAGARSASAFSGSSFTCKIDRTPNRLEIRAFTDGPTRSSYVPSKVIPPLTLPPDLPDEDLGKAIYDTFDQIIKEYEGEIIPRPEK